MKQMLIQWFLTALAVWFTSWAVPGFYVSGVFAALFAAVVIGLINATIGLFLKVITFPLTIVTFGLFWLIINGIILEIASAFAPGFHLQSFGAAFWGAIVLSLTNMLLKRLIMPKKRVSD